MLFPDLIMARVRLQVTQGPQLLLLFLCRLLGTIISSLDRPLTFYYWAAQPHALWLSRVPDFDYNHINIGISVLLITRKWLWEIGLWYLNKFKTVMEKLISHILTYYSAFKASSKMIIKFECWRRNERKWNRWNQPSSQTIKGGLCFNFCNMLQRELCMRMYLYLCIRMCARGEEEGAREILECICV